MNGLTVKDKAQSAITLSWTQNGGNITGYKVYYYDYSKKKWIYSGKTSETLYKVKGLTAGTTYKFRVRAYKNIDGTQYFGSYSSTVRTATKPKTPSITKLTTANRAVTIKYNKVSGASGYKIVYSTDPDFNTSETTSRKSSTTATIKGLTKGKTYYLKVRAYRTVDNNKIYSSYSSVMKIKVK